MDPRDIIEALTMQTCVPMEKTEEIEVEIGNPDKLTKIGKGLQGPLRQEIIELIQEFSNILA